VSKRRSYVALPCLTLVLSSLGHDDVVQGFPNQVLGVLGRPALHSCPPGKLNEHFTRTLGLATLYPLVLAQPLPDNEVVPDHPELFLSQVVRRPYYPNHLVRPHNMPRRGISCSHSRLTKAAAAAWNPEACRAFVVQPLHIVRRIPYLLPERLGKL